MCLVIVYAVACGYLPSAAATTLKWSSAYGVNAFANESTFFNLAQAADLGSVQAFEKVGIRSAIAPFQTKGGRWNIFNRSSVRGEGSFLVSNWSTLVDDLITRIRPFVSPMKVVGTFLGDEICCHAPQCMSTTIEPVAAKLRAAFPNRSQFFIWENECSDTIFQLPNKTGAVPDSLDILSVDIYDGYLPHESGADEVKKVQKFFETVIFPKMGSHQSTIVVPGLFGCDNLTSCGSMADQDARLVQKLEAYRTYLCSKASLDQGMMVGLAPWHLKTRSHSQNDKSACDMRLGSSEFPNLMAAWRDFGAAILNNTACSSPTS